MSNYSPAVTIETKRVAEVFDDWAERGRAEGMERGHALAARTGFERLNVGGDNRYLDIGCGNGYSVRWAAAISSDVRAVGIDVSAKMIERATEQSAELANAEFHCLGFPDPSLESHSFDRIFSMEVFYYLPNLAEALADVARILTPGGRFVSIIDHYRENSASHSWGPDMGLELHIKSSDEWGALFAAAGFASVEQQRVRAPSVDGKADGWEQTEGSLLTIGSIAT